jgi:hypothetical protein
MPRRVSMRDIAWYRIRQTRLNHFQDTGPTAASIGDATRRQEEKSWEDGDESDDMVVWASHACNSLMVAAIADDRHSDIES